ncbi:hypothetical protein EXT46_10210 [Pseudoalteromonas sp. CO325X]|nr:hypothetical protein EXT46_10210 [Pseudoalteromonas sp. CO325X]
MDFSSLTKKQTQSFVQQKKLLQQLSKGQEVRCEHCHGKVTLALGEPGYASARCEKGCTDVLLQLS